MRNRHRWLLRLRPATIAVFLKSVLGIKRFVVRTNAGAFFIDPVSNLGDALLTAGQYEPRLASVLSALLTAGDTFVDIGANEGYFSIIAAKLVGETGRVISIEPQSRLQAVIVRNLEENHVKNCTVSRKVISDNVGTTRLALSPDVNTGSSGIVPATRYRLPSESVASTTLTELFRDLEVRRVKLMKLDIEGSEYEAIFGALQEFVWVTTRAMPVG